jgi:hypothetical protein
MTTTPLPLLDSLLIPDYAASQVVVDAPGAGEGHWVGAPSAVRDGDGFWLAYRVRRPVDEGRGVATTLAWSPDGVRVEEVGSIRRETFGAASLERPALVRRPDGGWRLYVSCATPGSKHWWIDAIDAETVADLAHALPVTVLAGSDQLAVKDPVVSVGPDGWRMWVCCHPLDVAGQEDRMTTRLVTSHDGLVWSDGVTVLAPEPAPVAAPVETGRWDRRGTRIVAIVEPLDGPAYALYDGRATAQENWFERTGIAVVQADGTFAALGDEPVAQAPHGTGALRYTCVVGLAEGGYRLFFEASREDGAHDLRTAVIPADRPVRTP